MSSNTNPGNFANRPTEEVREIASKGGKSSNEAREMDPDNFAGGETGGGKADADMLAEKGGRNCTGTTTASSNGSGGSEDAPGGGNPGNFANRDKDEVREIASKGGKASSGNFVNRPHEEVVEIARKGGQSGGQASSGGSGTTAAGGGDDAEYVEE